MENVTFALDVLFIIFERNLLKVAFVIFVVVVAVVVVAKY